MLRVRLAKILSGALCLGALSPAGAALATETSRSWQLQLQLDMNSSLHRWTDPNHQAGSDLWIWPHYRVTPDLDLSLLSVLGKELTGERRMVLRSSDLILRQLPRRLNRFFRYSPALTLTPPLSTDRLNRESLILATRLSQRLLWDLAPAGAAPLTGFFEISGGRQFHGYSENVSGGVNNRYSLFLTAFASCSLGPRVSLNVTGSRISAWSYAGRLTNTFRLNQELSFQLRPSVALSVSHENAGPLLGPNGQESNFAVVNGQNSIVTTSISFSL